MVAYCPNTRRLAFGGKNGAIIVHELRASKAQVRLEMEIYIVIIIIIYY